MICKHVICHRALPFALASLFAAPIAFAQQAPPAMPSATTHSKMPMVRGGELGGSHGMGGGMGIVPPGTWWKNADVVTSLTLTADQQKRLDDIFLQSRIGLIHLHASLEEEQLKLEPLLNANPPDQARSLAQISRIADLRADVEKADAKMLLSLRGVLTADQWTKLQADQHSRHDRPASDSRDRKRGQQGPGNQQGPHSRGQRGPQGSGPGQPPPPPVDDQQ